MRITSPVSEFEWQKYYWLRYQVLRAPLGLPPGSEKIPDDATATHALLLDEDQEAVGVCRLHLQTPQEAQIRFMAIHPDHQGQGLGKKLLLYLEEKARQQGATFMTLQARENAVPFYKSCGYALLEKTHLLYGQVQHYKMQKYLG